jgi:hypothetical protein
MFDEWVNEGAKAMTASIVAIVDERVLGELPPVCAAAPMILVGETSDRVSTPAAQSSASVRVRLGWAESKTRLGEFLPLLEEIAVRGATAQISQERRENAFVSSSVEMPPRAPTPHFLSDPHSEDSWWDWLSDALEAAGSRAELLAEFRRLARRTLRTSHVVFFLRDAEGYRADRGDHFCAANDIVPQTLAENPTPLDGVTWLSAPQPAHELAVRQRLASWALRLIVPLHERGRVLGWIGLGTRDDGAPFGPTERTRAVNLARLLRQMLPGASAVGAADRAAIAQLEKKYFPGTRIFGPEDIVGDDVPAAVRDLITEVRKLRLTRRLAPSLEQVFRASAGFIPETQGVWALWEDVSAELQEQHRRTRTERLALLHDLALTLNHELGNSLVSLAALRHNPGAETNSPVLLAAIRRDIAALEAINRHLASLPTFSEVSAERVDLRALACAVGRRCGIAVETGSEEVLLDVAPKLIEFGLEAILDSIAENRPGLGKRELVLALRATGPENNRTALLTIRGASLALEGVLPAPEPGAAPTHGRIGVFIAKEIIRLHGGLIEGGSGLKGPEISLTIRNW